MSTLAAVLRSPNKVKIAVKMTMASTKLAIGPAATIAARAPSDLPWKLCLRSPPRQRSSGLCPALAAFSSSMNFT